MGGRRAVVLGAEGMIGTYMRDALLEDGWDVAGVARRPSTVSHERYVHIRADLLDPSSLAAAFGAFPDATHVFYAGFILAESRAAEVGPNLAMLVNGVEAVEANSSVLEHVCLFEGGKWYGCHTGPFKTPAYENDPRVMPPMFYYNQEDYLTQRRNDGATWSWSSLRPEGVGGVALSTPQGLLTVLVMYAVLCRELGIPLRFPGTPEARDALYEMTDGRLLARAAIHTSTTASCADQAFNVTNGDSFRWNDMFAYIASLLGMEYAGTQTLKLTEVMADKGPLWDNMVERYGLAPYKLEELAGWQIADNLLYWGWDNVRSTIKLRKTGFHDCIDSREMVRDVVERMVELKLIPPTT
ncbi:nucleoside-diphosphate-sugar epimerase [Microbacterium sp. BE35]|uniref:SDR family oxidoreductase n=1 Tax=Microbacterium sp. BE35 TaxID=2817773 RepID=UPI002861568C|nr:SDR family oxidoreductase [Microbacterium sp. BE35]MDR7188219.1 nucleoside-diphosphate-sugar epimerase [Microbacterium sp. BE35]